MKKLSKLFLAMILAFTSIVVFNPNQTKAQEASTYAMGTNVPVYDNTTVQNQSYQSGNLNCKYTITVSGSYFISNGTASNINISASVRNTDQNPVLKVFVKNCNSYQSGNNLIVSVKIGFKNNNIDTGNYITHTYTFRIR